MRNHTELAVLEQSLLKLSEVFKEVDIMVDTYEAEKSEARDLALRSLQVYAKYASILVEADYLCGQAQYERNRGDWPKTWFGCCFREKHGGPGYTQYFCRMDKKGNTYCIKHRTCDAGMCSLPGKQTEWLAWTPNKPEEFIQPDECPFDFLLFIADSIPATIAKIEKALPDIEKTIRNKKRRLLDSLRYGITEKAY